MKANSRIFLLLIYSGILLCVLIYGSKDANRYLGYFIFLFPIMLILIGIIRSGSISKFFKEANKEAHKTGVRRRAFIKSAFLGKEPEYYINKSIQKDKEKRKKQKTSKKQNSF